MDITNLTPRQRSLIAVALCEAFDRGTQDMEPVDGRLPTDAEFSELIRKTGACVRLGVGGWETLG